MSWTDSIEDTVRRLAWRLAGKWSLVGEDRVDAVSSTVIGVWRQGTRNAEIYTDPLLRNIVIRREMMRWLRVNKDRMDAERKSIYLEELSGTADDQLSLVDEAISMLRVMEERPEVIAYFRMRALGHTHEECAQESGITTTTYFRWMDKVSDYSIEERILPPV